MANKKLTKKEHEKLKNVVAQNHEIVSKRANLCLEKEIAIRQINARFDQNWEVAELNFQQSQRNQQNLLTELNLKYGDNKVFDLDTGEIRDQ